MAALTRQQIREEIDVLEEHRLEGTGNAFDLAWRAAKLAVAIERSVRPMTSESFGYLVFAVEAARSFDARLAKEDRTSADDNGDLASDRARSCLLWAAIGATK